jgi:methionyl-tRNA synthetase
MSDKRILITSALPYANGSIHIGHLVEYIQTDIFVRFLKLTGKNVIYCCADDTHGTAIEINAGKQGITPEKFIEDCYTEHTKDFKAFHIEFDSFYSTHSPENKKYVELIYNRLNEKGFIYKKDIELTYCEHEKRFLPDRYVKGKCPKCGAEDQYGDVCEVCNSTYKTTDLINPYCVICKNTPVRKNSTHYFFRLSAFSDKLKSWLTENDRLQPEVKNQVMGWVNNGLEDWNISRDGPYFGFNIPGESDKFFYVWMDAPIGYIASTANYCKGKDFTADDIWQSANSEIIHFIGKDIIYFHLLFWPAVLMGADFHVPDSIVVHGFLTVNKEKMSKSRGTFIKASEFERLSRPEFLRYYYASNLTRTMSDVDLDLNDYKDRINNELVANVANFFYRVLSFCNKNFNSEILPAEEEYLSGFDYTQIKDCYNDVEFRSVVKSILETSSRGNKYFQDNKPWALIKEDSAKAHQVVSNCVNLVKDIAILMKPIMPEFAKEMEHQLNIDEQSFSDLGRNLKSHKINEATILLRNIEKIDLNFKDQFADVDLKVAQILKVSDHPNADKLFILELNLGNETRTIVTGLRGHYTAEQLLGKKIVVVSNLKPASLRGVESRGMLLAAGTKKGPVVVMPESSEPGDSVSADGIPKEPKKEISIDEFMAFEIMCDEKGNLTYKGRALRSSQETIVSKGVTEKCRVK